MKLLVVTQIVDTNSTELSFFHRWIENLAPHYEKLEVICLKKGEFSLPENVRVYSLGKENGERSRFSYAIRFLSLAWKLRGEYDAVFVHMNQEYILIAGWLWKLLHKPIYMWRNHYAGSWLTDIAAAFCTKVFCTSHYSYTAKYKKTILMPVGVDLERFQQPLSTSRENRSILFFTRIAPSKRPDVFVEALGLLLNKSISFTASMYGSPKPSDAAYYESIQARAESLGLHNRLQFHAGVPNTAAAGVFRAHEIFVNCATSGMYDKMIFEAAASGCLVLTSSKDFKELAGDEFYFDATPESLAEALESHLRKDSVVEETKRLEAVTSQNSLSTLILELVRNIHI